MGKIITLTGPSGVGKGYVKRQLKHKLSAYEIPVYTTRPVRTDDHDSSRISVGEHEFSAMLECDELCMVDRLFNHMYGFCKIDVDSLEDHDTSITEIHVNNARYFRRRFESAIMIALIPESMEFLRVRLNTRGESDESTSRRLASAADEISYVTTNHEVFDLIYVVGAESQSRVLDDLRKYIEEFACRI